MITQMISKLINEAINKRKAALALCGILLMSSAPVYAQSAAEYPSQQAVSLGKLTATVAAIAGTGFRKSGICGYKKRAFISRWSIVRARRGAAFISPAFLRNGHGDR